MDFTMSLCVFLWFQVISGWNWGTWAKIRFRGWRRTADAAGFWPPCTRSGFSGDTELQMVRSQLRWKVDILCPSLDDTNWRSTPVPCCILELNARNRLQSGVKRQKQVTNWRSTPREASKRVKLNAQPKHTPSGPGSGFLHQLLISVNPSN